MGPEIYILLGPPRSNILLRPEALGSSSTAPFLKKIWSILPEQLKSEI